MTVERYLILTFAILGAGGAFAAGASSVVGMPPLVPFAGGMLSAISTVALGLLRGWFDAAPVPPHG